MMMAKKQGLMTAMETETETEHEPVPRKYKSKFDVKLGIIIGLVCALVGCIITIMMLLSIVFDDSSSASNARNVDDSGFGALIFEENFDTLDLSRWQHELTLSGGGNWEFEYYTNNRTNSYVKNGVLYIKPTLTNNTFTSDNFLTSGDINIWGGTPADQCTSNAFYGCERGGTAQHPLNAVQSARIRTVESFSFKYGKVEVRAQLPRGDWLWPAIWMLPTKNYYGQWPASGEVDIIESRGNDKLISGASGKDIGANVAGTTTHWGPYYGTDQFPMTTASQSLANGALYSAGFHNWTLEWTPQGFKCSVDGNLYWSVSTANGYWDKGQFDTKFPGSANVWKYGDTDAPFDQEFFFVINLAVGGVSGYWPDGSTSYPQGASSYKKPWTDSTQTTAQDFWSAVGQWYPTWLPRENNGESAALKVDYIRVYEYVS
mmetsp:Transcript_56125/g.93538  ORF Transcript_56125/g.93538 Transcript_56125/m.93538 type:complete len:431 (-) Transcript_56125:97-1389(-)|eukprot:CAMPEP_0202693204 /NCGR_PEP_ID=MMETSP1385-20130828/7383_1 /ASSEMBLY_ACC=CAM_ASM_000861 /TAXON_ID=933848 /ORGANISM="Elphidium margaritaceum" /LENGTH=430 /DNA_ID=CAMNT_0049348853 /DNA_START=46 /DNA_END=1338 /DNA_ORIENTATION=-